MGSRRYVLVLGVAVLSCAASGFAQERPGSLYAIGGISLPLQGGPSGETPQTYVAAPGGVTRGWLVGGGVLIASAVSAEIEWSSTGLMMARESSRYGMTFNEERRDHFVSLAVRFSLPRTGTVRLEPVVGMVFTNPAAWSQTERYMNWLTPQQVLVKEPRIEHHLDSNIGVTFGCDARVGGRHVALLPSFRMADTGVSHGFYDNSPYDREIGTIYPGGYPRWTIRSGVGIRVDFW